MDLNTLNLDELKSLKRDVDKAITSFRDRRRKEALAVVEAAAREHGMSLVELTGTRQTRRSTTGAVSEPKYRNPEDPSQTWSGRGRRPAWLAGRELEDFAI